MAVARTSTRSYPTIETHRAPGDGSPSKNFRPDHGPYEEDKSIPIWNAISHVALGAFDCISSGRKERARFKRATQEMINDYRETRGHRTIGYRRHPGRKRRPGRLPGSAAARTSATRDRTYSPPAKADGRRPADPAWTLSRPLPARGRRSRANGRPGSAHKKDGRPKTQVTTAITGGRPTGRRSRRQDSRPFRQANTLALKYIA